MSSSVSQSGRGRRLLSIGIAAATVAASAIAGVLTTRPPEAAPVVSEIQPQAVIGPVAELPHLKARLEASEFMGAVLVARDDQVVFRQAYGMADREAGRVLKTDDRFRLASVSKQFTAAALLKLEDQGALRLDDPVCRWIMPCPAAWSDIRLVHLLSHTSGIPDLMSRPGWGQRRVTPATLDELTTDSAGFSLRFRPGERLRYNNAGFNLAAAVVEKASGQRFDDYLHAALFAPLGLAQTGLGDMSDLVMGYADLPGGLVPQRLANVSIVEGAGAMYSTLDDLLIWQRALHGGRVLSPRAYGRMIADHRPTGAPPPGPWPPTDVGLGVFAGALGERVTPGFPERQIYHTGSWAGFQNLMIYQPEHRISVIVLSNNYHQRPEVFLIAQQALAEALGRPFPTGPAVPPSRATRVEPAGRSD